MAKAKRRHKPIIELSIDCSISQSMAKMVAQIRAGCKQDLHLADELFCKPLHLVLQDFGQFRG